VVRAGADRFEPTERSTLLDVSGAELATSIDWPPSG
jgi:hypothetical protein